MRALPAAAALGAMALGLGAWAQQALTLPEALRRVGQTSVQADTAKLAVASAKEESLQIKALYYPSITLEGGHTNLDNQPFFKFDLLAFPSGNKVFWQYQFNIQEVLWDGGRRSAALDASRTREEAVELKGGAQVRKAQAQMAERYVSLLTLKAQRAAVDQRRKALEDYHRVVKDLFDLGVVARNDLLRTEVAIRTVDDQATQLDAAYATGIEVLNQAMGLPPTAPLVLPPDLPSPPPIPWDDATCRTRAEENNDAVKAMAAKVKALDQAVVLKKKDYYPTLVAQAAHSYQQNDYLLYPDVNALFVGLSVDLYDGGARASRIRQARVEADSALRQLMDLKGAVEVAAGQALRDFNESLKETRTAQANVEAAVENLRIVEDQYKEGLARTTDVLDAESVLAESRFALGRTHYQAYAKQAALLAAMGEDLPAFYERAGEVAMKEIPDGRD